jgi:hypothetical protein
LFNARARTQFVPADSGALPLLFRNYAALGMTRVVASQCRVVEGKGSSCVSPIPHWVIPAQGVCCCIANALTLACEQGTAGVLVLCRG